MGGEHPANAEPGLAGGEPPANGALGLVGGSGLRDAPALEGATPRRIPTPFGEVVAHAGEGFVFLRRHGEGIYRPPHRVPHRAHVLAMEALGVRRVVGLASVGSLTAEIGPGDVVVPDDYLSWHPPPTFAEDEFLHIVPRLDPKLRALLLGVARAAAEGEAREGPGPTAAGEARGEPGATAEGGPSGGHGSRSGPAGPRPRRVLDGAVYAETRGPRFETPAEVRMLARHAALVGMTAASEATLFQERGIAYAMICFVDNFAHGVGPEPLSLEAFQRYQAAGRAFQERLVEALVETGSAGGVRAGGSAS